MVDVFGLGRFGVLGIGFSAMLVDDGFSAMLVGRLMLGSSHGRLAMLLAVLIVTDDYRNFGQYGDAIDDQNNRNRRQKRFIRAGGSVFVIHRSPCF